MNKRIKDWVRRFLNSKRFEVPFWLSRNITVANSIPLGNGRVDLNVPDEHGVVADYTGIFLDDCYGLHSLSLPDSPNILDVGANVGFFAVAARQTYPNGSIHCYEPAPELEKYLSHHANEAEFTYFMEAVGPKDGSVKLSRHGDSNLTTVDQTGEGEIPMTSFQTAKERMGKTIDLLKLDCEGGEWPLLERETLWSDVQRIVMEYHLWATSRMDHRDVREKVERLGYKVTKIPVDSDREFGILWAVRV